MSTATVAMNGWTGVFNRPAMLLAATGAVGICVYLAAFHGWLWFAAAFAGGVLDTWLRPLFGLR